MSRLRFSHSRLSSSGPYSRLQVGLRFPSGIIFLVSVDWLDYVLFVVMVEVQESVPTQESKCVFACVTFASIQWPKQITWLCNREEQNLTSCWVCYFDFNLLLLVLSSYIIVYLREHCLSACMLNKSSFVQLTGRQCDPAHLWMAAEKKKWTYLLLDAGQASYDFSTLLPHFLPLCSIKEIGIQTLIWWFFFFFFF